MTALFRRIAVLGVGLLGGSVGLAAKARGAAETVVGAGRPRDALEAARRRGAVDEVADAEVAVRAAGLVVLATPVRSMPELVRRVAPHLCAGALVTDVGSVKGELAETLPGIVPPGVHFVGAHPMAGSHLRGVEHARADLFKGVPCVVASHAGDDPRAVERVCRFWERLGARVVRRDPSDHDAEIAWISHLPHVLAFALAKAVGGAPRGAGDVSGPSFQEFTRLALSDAELWSDILTANRKAIAGPLQDVAAALASLGGAIESNDAEAVEQWIAGAREALAGLSAGDPLAAAGANDVDRERSPEGKS